MIRVISGIYRGKRLKKVPGLATRPMPDKLKTALFNILRDEIAGTTVLDGFAGTGSIGIEALSRGAEQAVFVEEAPAALSVLRHNLGKIDAAETSRVVAMEFNRGVIQLARENFRFDIVFLDPPYKLLDERNPLKVIRKRGVLAPGGLIVLRHHFKTRFEGRFFDLKRRTTLGDDTLSFYGE
ncbi:MAG: 16S rRNA (guanine(966)-N(2))-methyltransferase RsmD [Acidobacteriota bacterium]|nr:16S rRNA (guanine(966)-N(2))-methyltransferase RsmD [Acidobacteriota bacterium]